jgi:CRISPR-associated protein Csd1
MYFDDLRIVRNAPSPRDRPLPPIPALDALLGCLAPFGNRKEVPVPLATAFVSAALRGTQFPVAVLQRALERSRAEIGKDSWADLNRRDARAALIKAVLLRRRRIEPSSANYPEPGETMDPNNQNPGYLLGRLMAVLERLQQAALDNPNASVVDRYFSAASATPRGVFVRLLKNARHHARKAEDDERNAGFARWLDRQVDDIADRFDPRHNGFPAALSLEDQAMFVLGYHQQRHWLWLSKEERANATAAQTAA